MEVVNTRQPGDWIEESFQLAFFILRDRPKSVATVRKALTKFELQRKKEMKRAYWRNKHLKHWITKVSKTDVDILQWLVYAETSHGEREQEQAGILNPEMMVVRYVKSLVQMTTVMSAFYLNVGLQRLLRNYTTAETQRLYETVTRRHVGDEEHRRAKGLIMAKLQARFSTSLRTVRCAHGELRFEAMPDQDHWTALVDECLQMFTPWSTHGTCPVPLNFDAANHALPKSLAARVAAKTECDIVETNWFHVLLDPVCFNRLTRSLGLGAPQTRLSVPKFFTRNSQPGGPGNRRGTPLEPPLSEHERTEIHRDVAEQARRRQSASPSIFKVIVDGVERLRVETEDCVQQFEIAPGAEQIEVWGEDQAGELLLASQRIRYDEQDFAPLDVSLALRGRRELRLRISCPAEDGTDPGRAVVTLTCKSALSVIPWRSWRADSWLFALPKYAFPAVILVVLGWWLGMRQFDRKQMAQRSMVERLEKDLAGEKELRSQLQNQGAASATRALASYKLVRDDLALRASGNSEIEVVLMPPKPTVISLELPLGDYQYREYRAVLRPFLEQREVLAETLVPANPAAATPAVNLLVPSSLLESDCEYTVELRQVLPAGRSQKVGSFTFRTAKNKGGGL